MALVLSLTTDDVFIGLQAWIADVTGVPLAKVIRELSNKVPEPLGEFILMRGLKKKNQGWNYSTYDVASTETIVQPTEFKVQVDCYGERAGDLATILATMFETDNAVAFMAPFNICPLWGEDAVEMPIVNGEEQYENRFVLRLHLQYNPTLAAPMQFMIEAKATIINAELQYPL